MSDVTAELEHLKKLAKPDNQHVMRESRMQRKLPVRFGGGWAETCAAMRNAPPFHPMWQSIRMDS